MLYEVITIARSLGILTVAVVTKPFAFEGSKRLRLADQGLEELSPHSDSVITSYSIHYTKLYDPLCRQKDVG